MSIKGINFKTKIWPCLTVFSSPDLVSVLNIFLLQTAIHCTRISETFELLIFLWHSKQHTQHLICCKWCNYHFLNVLHFEHNDILFSDFGSWISLVELNLGTNQLSRLPGMLSWVYDYITSTYGKNHWTTVFIWVYRSLELLWVYLTSLCGEHCFKKLANLQPSFEMFSIKFD